MKKNQLKRFLTKAIQNTKALALGAMLLVGAGMVEAQCTGSGIDCNPNTFVNSSDPNTIEYDNVVSGVTTIAKTNNGVFTIWGQAATPTGGSYLAPTAITTANGFSYTGTPLKATAGSFVDYATPGFIYYHAQNALLTTNGLYVWGSPNRLVSSSIKSGAAFGKITVNGKTDGLPAGVTPNNVKMMFGSHQTLAIVTCSGEAWVLSMSGDKNGDGTAQNGTNNVIWHRVKTSAANNLNNVVAVRGNALALFALTSDGKLYTWGTGTYLGNGSAVQNRTYATEVTVPNGVTPKMIGMTMGTATSQPYYLLATDGRLFAMGENAKRQLGDGTIVNKTTWVQTQKMTDQNGQGTGPLVNIAWISPNEHTADNNTSPRAAVNVLTNNKKLWGWGIGRLIGGASFSTYYDPVYMPGISTNTNGMKLTDEIIMVETGGDYALNYKKGSDKFGFVGYSVYNKGDGSNTIQTVPVYAYDTAVLMVCAASVGPSVQDLKICNGTTANLNNANLEAVPAEIEWHATNSAASPVMTNITAVAPGTYYAFYTVASGKSRTVSSPVTVSYYLSTDADAPCYDTDGDGVPDTIDLDNDNDGILDTDECATDAGKIVEWNHNNSSSPWAATSVQSTYISSATNSVTGSGITARSHYITTSWLSGITSKNYDDAVSKNTYVEYAFTTAAFGTTVNHMYDKSWFWWTGDGTHTSNKYKLAVAISNDNFATKTTLLLDVVALQNFSSSTVNNLTKYKLQPGTAYKVRVYIYGLTNPGEIIDYDDYSIMLTNFCDTDGDGIPDYLDLDSDNDGCLDAIEGSENVTTGMLVAAATGLSVGTGSSASNQNLCTGTGCVDAQGVPTVVNAGGAADTGNNQGQGVGSSQDASDIACTTEPGLCAKPGATGTALTSSVGILTKGQASVTGWPETVPNGYLVLDGAFKGMVITHMTTAQISALTPVEGMLVFDTNVSCVKLYRGTSTTVEPGRTGWVCIERICIDPTK